MQELSVNERAMYFVAEIDGQIAGYAGLWQIVDEGHITNVAVAPQFRRQKSCNGNLLRLFLQRAMAPYPLGQSLQHSGSGTLQEIRVSERRLQTRIL